MFFHILFEAFCNNFDTSFEKMLFMGSSVSEHSSKGGKSWPSEVSEGGGAAK